MFVQVVQGKVADEAALQAQFDRWLAELSSGATGWLGFTGGVTDDGHGFLAARFDSEAAARANSERAEQGAWWEQTAACFAGDPEFVESADVSEVFGGGSDAATFVQVMVLRTTRRADLERLDAELEPTIKEVQAALMGGLRVWTPPDHVIEVNYFTDEASARAGEQAMGENAEVSGQLAEWRALLDSMTFYDLRRPTIVSP